MIDGWGTDGAGLSPTRVGQIESVCDRFEAAWKEGGRPRIEEFCEADDAELFRELLVLELVYRRQGDEQPNLSHYLERFPEHGDEVRSAFAAATRAEAPAPPVLKLDDTDPDADVAGPVGFTAPGRHAPRFRVLRPLAQGGLGEVFVANDEELRREVALKVIRERHAGDSESRYRFQFEAEITGRLEHPGVIPVYGLGVDARGRPYYAMRFVRGQSLKESIERFHAEGGPRDPGERSLALRELLGRFIAVCNTIDYAHGRGILHRDLKPANVMLGPYGETLVVDWGLAKLTASPDGDPGAKPEVGRRESSGDGLTQPGSWLGTPPYMSPEQADGRTKELGPASDVYSLGATLYTLLCGRAPVEGDDVTTVLARVRHGDFPPPRSLDPTIDRALEAICLKAMSNRPQDRYASCRGLADDVARWAAGEPVSAWREPFDRRLRRWAGRNRSAVAAVGAGVLASLVGLSAVLVVQTRAKDDLAKSLKRETAAKTALAAANADLVRSRAAVQARYDLAVDAVRTFHTGVSEDFLLREDRFKDLRDRLLKSAGDFYGRLGTLLGEETDPASRRALSQADFEVADLTAKVGRREAAIEAHRKVLAAREALANGPSSDPAWAERKADVGRSLTALAILLEQTGKTDQALVTYRDAAKRLVAAMTQAPDAPPLRAALADCRSRLGALLHATGKTDDALPVLTTALADLERLTAAPSAPDATREGLAKTIDQIGALLFEMGKPRDAEAEFGKALTIRRALADANPTSPRFQSELALGHLRLGNFLLKTRKHPAASAEFGEALKIQQKLADASPAVNDFQATLALLHYKRGELLFASRQSDAAEVEYRKALKIRQKLVDENPAIVGYRNDLAISRMDLGWLLYMAGKGDQAADEQREATILLKKLTADNPTVLSFWVELAQVYKDHGTLFSAMGRGKESEAEHRKALAIRRKLADENPKLPEYRREVTRSLNSLGEVLLNDERPRDAVIALEESRDILEALVKDYPSVSDFETGLAMSLSCLGRSRRYAGDLSGAVPDLRRAISIRERLPALTPGTRYDLARNHALLAGIAAEDRSILSAAEGQDAADRAMAVLNRATALGFRNPNIDGDQDLNSLRDRPDFRLLMLDMVFPANPFAPD